MNQGITYNLKIMYMLNLLQKKIKTTIKFQLNFPIKIRQEV